MEIPDCVRPVILTSPRVFSKRDSAASKEFEVVNF